MPQRLNTGAAALAKGVQGAAAGSADVAAGAAKVSGGAAALSTGAGTAKDGAAALATGAGTLSAGTAELATGTGNSLTAEPSSPPERTSCAAGSQLLTDKLDDGGKAVPNDSAELLEQKSQVLAAPVAVNAQWTNESKSFR